MSKFEITIDDFLNTYDSPTNYGKKYARELVSDKILPLHLSNPRIIDVNILANWVFWSGCIFNHYAEISHEDKSILTPISENLTITPAVKANRVVFTPNTKYARILETMGIENCDKSGKKPDYVSHIPWYLSCISKTLPELTDEERSTAKQIFQDSARIIIQARYRNNCRQPYIQLNGMRLESDSHQFSIETLGIFQTAFPELGLEERHLEFEERKDKGTYHSKIRFNKKQKKITNEYILTNQSNKV